MAIDPSVLEGIPILASLGRTEIQRIASVSRHTRASKRQLIIEKLSDVKGLWILLDGRLQGIDYTIDGREVGLYFITPGQFFGELSLVDQQPYPEHIVATAASELLLIPRTIYHDLVKIHPEIATTIASTLAIRIRGLIKQRTLLTLATPMQRLAAQLIDLAIEQGDRIEINFIPTHQELAMMINASRETVTRAFRTLQTNGVVKRDGNKLIVNNGERLEQMARGDHDRLVD